MSKDGLYLEACLILRNCEQRNQGLDFALKCSHMRKMTVVSFILLLMAFSGAFADQCVNKLSVRKPHFEFIDYRLEMGEMSRMPLGFGGFADVFLQFNKYKDKWEALKMYRHQYVDNKPIDPTPFIESDIKAAEILSQLSDRHPFKVVEYRKHPTEHHVVEVDYYAGTTLEQVLMNNKLDKKIKESLVFTYESGIKKLKAEMEKKNFDEIVIQKLPNNYDETSALNTLRARATISGKRVNFWIKPDNILVDPYTLELILFDPH